MPDILGQGGDDEPRRWPRRLAVVAALVLAAAVVIALHLPHGGHAPQRPHQPAAASPAPLPISAPVADGLAGRGSGISGPTLPMDPGLRLPVTGPRPAWFWPATGRTEPIRGLPRDPAGYQFTRAGGGWTIQAVSANAPGCGNCAGPALPAYFLPDGAAAATPVGLATAVAPGATDGTLWLTSYPPGADLSTAVGLAREVRATGAPAGAPVRLPAGYQIDRATDRGLLLAPAAQGTGTAGFELWDPATSRAGRSFTGVVAASAGDVAWAPQCGAACQVEVLDLRTGRQTTVTLPGVSSAASAAFSPDGSLLALEVSFYNGGDGGQLATQLDVASAATGRVTVVPGTWVSSDALAGFGWPAGGDTLIAELSFMTTVQVASWHPGSTRPGVAAIRPGQGSASLILG
ncbi:MAG TPA: hypothetical protein VMF87_15915 [Streptosporangiaceae bacterium]|nr:hypothetical protein [Streptosporangiaceae bacterium]